MKKFQFQIKNHFDENFNNLTKYHFDSNYKPKYNKNIQIGDRG